MKPIIFNTEMVQAILDGNKSQTRRVIKRKGYDEQINASDMEFATPSHDPAWWDIGKRRTEAEDGRSPFLTHLNCIGVSPRYQPGDTLYVRETWAKLCEVDENGFTHYDRSNYYYRTDGEQQIDLYDDDGMFLDDQNIKWKPSIHMPKEAARIFLRVTDVRVERLQDISSADVAAEGISREMAFVATLGSIMNTSLNWRGAYAKLWNELYAKKGYGWESNPWVGAYTFERCEKPEETQ